ncbi:flavin-containing monooxygenase [Mycolicibacterium poriferae]|uniref:flavin-containing monooxygenase n=1 Tax=Mycolicibacterium poriferae TaxID=39694 RepID=UPI003D2F80F0
MKGGSRVLKKNVLIIGAGISGVGAARYLTTEHPAKSLAIVEAREAAGGTWDLFRYPGIRSDSDLYTFGYEFKPWRDKQAIADAPRILDYLHETIDENGLTDLIRYRHKVVSAAWSSADARWLVDIDRTDTGERVQISARWIFCGSGYYDYDEPYRPDFAGIENFAGPVVHPQLWPESLDYTGKRVVVIGSGATAISMIPAVARKAGHVTMLQRSPTYLLSGQRINPVVNLLRKVPPRRLGYRLAWLYNVLFIVAVYGIARRAPGFSRKAIRAVAKHYLPENYPVDTHFKPTYDPWDQRLCLILSGDFYDAIGAGRAEVVTDEIDHIDESGVVCKSGTRIDADVLVTATGLRLQALGGVALSVDGEEVKPADRFVYKEHLLEDVPNLAWCVGYINASWTLRADLTARAVAKLLAYMDSHGYTHAYPHLGATPMEEKPAWDINAGYVRRAVHVLPKSGTHRPWNVRHNYVLDAIDHRLDRVEESMVFGRAAVRAVKTA